jgi:hypothetical protein
MKNNNESYLIFTKKDNLSQLSKQGIQVTILKEFSNFHISQLSTQFINYETRPATLQQYVIARITTLKECFKFQLSACPLKIEIHFFEY